MTEKRLMLKHNVVRSWLMLIGDQGCKSTFGRRNKRVLGRGKKGRISVWQQVARSFENYMV